MQKLSILKNGNTVLVRKATFQDALDLNSLAREVFGTSKTVLTSLEEFKSSMDSLNSQLQRIKYYQNTVGHLLLVAETDGRVVGTLDFSNGQRQRIAHTGEFGMSVAPAYQNQGIGRCLLELLVEWASKDPIIEKVKLTVFANNDNARHLYKSLGFIEEGKGINEIKMEDGLYFDVVNMYKNTK